MNETCFYCEEEIEGYLRFASFVYENDHVEKPLCQHCYHEWLEGIKN
ncbi:hypothetical protein J2S74_002248 [Evansella vedderi]|uniref:Small CPxCG-related zinc finger protein n=1 Tax=Evansella vedderi TaxID=38282 RepID=A0ABT9ZUE1_9BACI|nr:hypothetical protein [Evansella vedderi]MDQ0254866.1 hypothetical protein [Evansella vedderi]